VGYKSRRREGVVRLGRQGQGGGASYRPPLAAGGSSRLKKRYIGKWAISGAGLVGGLHTKTPDRASGVRTGRLGLGMFVGRLQYAMETTGLGRKACREGISLARDALRPLSRCDASVTK
jgi:hypothetical protein